MYKKIIKIGILLSAIFFLCDFSPAGAQNANTDTTEIAPAAAAMDEVGDESPDINDDDYEYVDEDEDEDENEYEDENDLDLEEEEDLEITEDEENDTEPESVEEEEEHFVTTELAATKEKKLERTVSDESDVEEGNEGENSAESNEIGEDEESEDEWIEEEETDQATEESVEVKGHRGSRKIHPPKLTGRKHKRHFGKKTVKKHHGWVPPLWSVIGFVGLLLSIAIIPLVNEHWWEPNLHKGYVALIFGVPLLIYLLSHAPHNLAHTMVEYVSFMALLGSLFYISGGIFLQGDIEATPRNNTLFIAAGTVMASFVGTTGAAMLLIRPVLRTNGERKRKMHTIIFFIFLVCNIGGSLTPMGDPPLFMGYLRGVPFTWTFNLWKQWLPMSLVLLAIYYCLDWYHYNKEVPEDITLDKTQILPLRLKGSINFLWLLGVIASIYFLTPDNVADWFGESRRHVPFREVCMVLMALISWKTTPHGIREAQSFTMAPIIEVAVLFAGIFVTMVPALMLLEIKGPEMGVNNPWQFYWFTGVLSSFLDNTPTYLVFFELGKSISHGANLIAGVTYEILEAISIGAVFMGANTYIGNGPNFMVKAIAEENSVKMPSFFGYMLWSMGILMPLFVVVTFVYFV